jgi:glucan phosphorylase
MSGKMRAGHPMYGLLPTEIEGFDSLAELALDMRWSWNHSTDEVWRRLDPELWEDTHNPWVVLQTVSRERIEQLLAEPAFRKKIEGMVQTRHREMEAPAWFQRNHPDTTLTCAAYFSMEFMLSEALPIYSGGLGNVAGDQLKATSDLGVPVVGVGLLDQQGYFRQVIEVKARDDQLAFELEVWLGELDPHSVRIELYADGPGGGPPVRIEMNRGHRQAGTVGSFEYSAVMSAGRPSSDYTPE